MLCSEGDVLVLPSYAEGLAMSVLEGLAHGLAVVTTPVGAHCEVIEPEVSGILVSVGDEAALAESLLRVISDAALRRRLADAARHRFLEKFEVSGYAARLERIHATLLLKRQEQAGPMVTDKTS
jgi:glycosyltransferase involved in cell wall biosynthesis